MSLTAPEPGAVPLGLMIGSDPARCVIVVDDPDVEPVHALVRRHPGARDEEQWRRQNRAAASIGLTGAHDAFTLLAFAPTWLNGQAAMIGLPVNLPRGTTIRVGSTLLPWMGGDAQPLTLPGNARLQLPGAPA